MKPPEIRALVQERMDEALGRVGGEADLEVVRRPGGKGKRPVFAATARSWRADGRILPTVAEALATTFDGGPWSPPYLAFCEKPDYLECEVAVWCEGDLYKVRAWIDKVDAGRTEER